MKKISCSFTIQKHLLNVFLFLIGPFCYVYIWYTKTYLHQRYDLVLRFSMLYIIEGVFFFSSLNVTVVVFTIP